MSKILKHPLFTLLILSQFIQSQTFHDSLLVQIPAGSFIMGEAEADYLGPPGSYDADQHTVNLSAFRLGRTEITNQQYMAFLNAAQAAGLVEVAVDNNPGPDNGFTLVYGSSTAPESYQGNAILNLSGTRVMKDHNNDDGDNNPFTGVIEPENPLNLSYIGYDESREAGDWFYLKDPANPADFDWQMLTNYYNYTSTAYEEDTSELLNDYSAWPELSDYPNNLPTLEEIKDWPASFIRWYGAKAFALFYSLDLPTEAQWEYAALGGAGFVYATADGAIQGDGSSAIWNHLEAHPAAGHVLSVWSNEPNPYGLYNMAGNVWEWIEDWYASDYYASTADALDPVNTTDSNVKVRRGGSWNYHLSTLKTAARAKDEKFKGNDHFGFRVVDNRNLSGADTRLRLPQNMTLSQNFPNPFNPTTTIKYSLPEQALVKLTVFDIRGQEIASLQNSVKPAGNYEVQWDGLDQSGNQVSTGVYLARLQAGGSNRTIKMVLLQ